MNVTLLTKFKIFVFQEYKDDTDPNCQNKKKIARQIRCETVKNLLGRSTVQKFKHGRFNGFELGIRVVGKICKFERIKLERSIQSLKGRSTST